MQRSYMVWPSYSYTYPFVWATKETDLQGNGQPFSNG